jgi:hypothetical protein
LRWDNRFWLIAIPAALLIGAGLNTGQASGLFFVAFAGLALFYATRESIVPLWLVSALSAIYGGLGIFGSGPLPLAASLVLLVGVAFWAHTRHTA